MFNKILCPTDGSDHAYKALDLAIDMAKRYDAELVILHVPHGSENIEALRRFAEIEGLAPHVNKEIDRLESMDYRISVATESAFQDSGISPRVLIDVGHHIIKQAKRHAERNGVENINTLLEGGDPADRILKCIDSEKIDCVIMGSRGLNDLKGLFLGSVSHKVANRAPCTCIAVK
ncbi:MAG: universal stress protein [Gammaproteobacteria bacterium]|nr:universal stress protein [Gammaproteobacteria bacterium]